MKSTSLKANPLLGLPAAKKLKDLSPETRTALCDLLKELAISARSKAEHSWSKGKAPMATYWNYVASLIVQST
jgi:hypothetical protein